MRRLVLPERISPVSRHEPEIFKIVERIERSVLSPKQYIQSYPVPFGIAQFYRYRNQLSQTGKDGLKDQRKAGNHRKLGQQEIVFLRGFVKGKAEVSPTAALRVVADEFGTEVHRSTMSRLLRKWGVVTAKPPSEVLKKR